MRDWSDEELERYSRQIILQEVGIEGQERLLNSSVLIVGLGGLGSVAALYLAAAGVGRLGLADFDAVDLSNLQRQIIHKNDSIGKNKAESAKEAILQINPQTKIELIKEPITSKNVAERVANYDFVIDASDNFATKLLINDACVMLDLPFSHGAAVQFFGRAATIEPRKSACFVCSFNIVDPSKSLVRCASDGVLAPTVGVIGSLQALEAIKYLSGVGGLLSDRFVEFDAKNLRFREIQRTRNPQCKVCGDGVKTSVGDYAQDACAKG